MALMLATGLLAGLCGPLFIWLMDYSHRGFVKLKLAPPWQLALGGLIVGGLSLITPAVWGNGYSVVQSYLLLPPSGALLVGVFICKLLAVLASSGSGAPGGVFTPTLFVGLAMGMLFACFSRLWLPGSEEMAIMMGLTGMAAFLAATTHAPIMSTLMICEMTGRYTLLPGLLITCVVSSVAVTDVTPGFDLSPSRCRACLSRRSGSAHAVRRAVDKAARRSAAPAAFC